MNSLSENGRTVAGALKVAMVLLFFGAAPLRCFEVFLIMDYTYCSRLSSMN